ncbi:MAG: universal stress protein [Cytophagales bacterium]|nr:universal stress protein [Cytophagales bacterium]MDW8385334.1 universal stress protein [Flammeovirgaceae bacterium]
MKKILVPVDFSKTSQNALAYAVEYALETKAKIHVFHVIQPLGGEVGYSFYGIGDRIISELESEAQKYLQDITSPHSKKKYKGTKKSLEISWAVHTGAVVEEANRYITTENYNGVFVGTKSQAGSSFWLWGSVTYQIISSAKAPVVTIPSNAKYESIKEILYASNFTPDEVDYIDYLREIASYFNARITCLHIDSLEPNTIANQSWQQMEEMRDLYSFLPVSELDFKIQFNEKVESGIFDYLKKNKVDVIAVLQKERSFIEQLFHHSVSRTLPFHSEIPVLILKEKYV